MNGFSRIGLSLMVAALAMPAAAGSPIEVEMTCPVGGESFVHIETLTLSIWGERPDGKPYGSWTFPAPLAECPSNALVMYREFTPEEIAPLTELVNSDEYIALNLETSYYRAAWLAERMDPEDLLAPMWLILQAVWQADDMPMAKERYQREFASRAAAVDIATDDLDSVFLRYRLANTYRELGDFPAALAALDSIIRAARQNPMPEYDASQDDQAANAADQQYLIAMLPMLRKVIQAGDASSEPVDLVPEIAAAEICAILEDEGTALPDRCNEPSIRQQMSGMMAAEAAAEAADDTMVASDAMTADPGSEMR